MVSLNASSVADSTSDMGCGNEGLADPQGCVEGSAGDLPHLGKHCPCQQAFGCHHGRCQALLKLLIGLVCWSVKEYALALPLCRVQSNSQPKFELLSFTESD